MTRYLLTGDTANSDYGGGIPDDIEAVIPYIDRRFANWAAAKRRFPKLAAAGLMLPITCGELHTSILDYEAGNANPDAGGWVSGSIAAGVFLPVVYSDLDHMKREIIPSLAARFGPIPEPGKRQFGIFTAHPGQGAHICAPNTCGQLSIKADATQHWWGSIDGHGSVDMDLSLLPDYFFKALVHPPKPPPKPSMHYDRYDTAKRIGHGAPSQSEARTVVAYDKYRAQQTLLKHPHRPELAVLRADCLWYAQRVASLMIANAPKGKRLDLESKRSHEEHWGWRYKHLLARSRGARIHEEL